MNNGKSVDIDSLYENIILKLIFFYCDQYNLKSKNTTYIHIVLKIIFAIYRKKFLKYYMFPEKHPNKNKQVNTNHNKIHDIDRHKIAACVVKALLFIKPIKIPFNCENHNIPSWKIVLVNEYLAISCAFSIIQTYIEANEDNRLKHKIITPMPFPSDDNDYIKDTCLDLYYSGYKKFNVISYANIFFLLEKYSCRKQRYNNLANEYRQILKKKYSILLNETLPNSDLISSDEALLIKNAINNNSILSTIQFDELINILVENRIYNAELEIKDDNIQDINENILENLRVIINNY